MKLFRPVGVRELELIADTGFRAFPPRLPDQPYFYPVFNFEYAEQIARDWNAKDKFSGYAGFVTEFEVADELLGRYEPRVVGSSSHREFWIPANELDEFNANIRGKIRVTAHYAGPEFSGEIDAETHLPSSVHADPAEDA